MSKMSKYGTVPFKSFMKQFLESGKKREKIVQFGKRAGCAYKLVAYKKKTCRRRNKRRRRQERRTTLIWCRYKRMTTFVFGAIILDQ